MVTYRGFSRVVPMKYLVFPCFPYFFACFDASVFRERWSSSAGTWTRTNCRSAWIVAPCYQTPSEEKKPKKERKLQEDEMKWWRIMKYDEEVWKCCLGTLKRYDFMDFVLVQSPDMLECKVSMLRQSMIKPCIFWTLGSDFFRKSKWPAAPAMAKVAGDGRCWNAWYVHLDSWHFNRGAAASSNFDQFGPKWRRVESIDEIMQLW